MWSLVFALENILPHCLEKTQLQWVQWIYALWQLLRGNPLILLVLSFLPYYVRQKLKKKTVVVIGEAKDIDMTYKELEEYIKYHEVINMEVVSCERPRDFHLFYKVRHNGYYYITHENTMCELAKCSMLFGANVIFVEKLLPVSATLAVGKLLTQTEAYEKIMSKRYHCSRGPKVVVPTSLIYSDFSSKFWAVLSTLPILLQAKDYKRTSNLLILLIILLDLNRIWLYALYDRFFNRFTRFVKLNIFKGGTHYYNFFSIFSSRWRYSDTVKKHAYLAKPGEEMNIRWYCKLKSLDDIEIVGWDLWNHDPNDQHIFLELFPDNSAYRAECKLMQYNEYVAKALLKKHVYVP